MNKPAERAHYLNYSSSTRTSSAFTVCPSFTFTFFTCQHNIHQPLNCGTILRNAQDRLYKVALLTFKVRSTSTPSYLCHLIQDREHGRNLRSTTTTLCQPSTATFFAQCAFRCSAPAVWNSLPQTVLGSDSVAVSKSMQKTFLVSQAFSSSSAH